MVKTELYEAYARAAKAMGCSHPVSQDTFAKRVKKIFGWGAVRNGSAPREWKVTGWAESKAAFEKFTRVRVADDGDEEADDDEDFAVSDLISAKSADLQNFTVSDDCSDLV